MFSEECLGGTRCSDGVHESLCTQQRQHLLNWLMGKRWLRLLQGISSIKGQAAIASGLQLRNSASVNHLFYTITVEKKIKYKTR